MENDSLIDVIDGTTELFGGQNDGGGLFNWADEFICDETEVPPSAREQGNLAPAGSGASVLSGASYAASTPSQLHTLVSSHPLPHPRVSGSNTDLQKSAVGVVVTQSLLNPLHSAGQGMATQIVQQGNQQFILKTAGSGPIQLNTQGGPQLQFQQILPPGMASSGGTQFHMPSSLSRTPNQSPAPAATLGRSLTPNSGGLSLSHASPSHSVIGGQFKSGSPVPNVNFVNLPGLQQPQQLQLAPGTVLQIPGSVGAPSIVNPGLIQGQTTILGNQGQNIVNAQNTVIQNPNVVNVNVAAHHVLCNNPQTMQPTQNPIQVQQQFQIQNQQKGISLGNFQTAAQNPFNIQGTLIQTAEGKNILIPSQNMSQPVNIQNVQQLAMPAQIGQIQGQLGGQSAQLSGSAGNLLRLQQQAQQDSRSVQGLPQIVLNSQGQQVIIQRASTPGSQPQNIVVCTVPQSNLVQLHQPGLQAGSAAIHTQAQQGQPQSLHSVMGVQNQQLKVVNQATASLGGPGPMINICGQNVSLQQLSSQLGGNIQFVQQPQGTPGHVITSQQGHIVASQQGHTVASQQGHMIVSQQGHTVVGQQGYMVASQQGHTVASQQGHTVASHQGHGGVALQGQRTSQIVGSVQDTMQGSPRRTASSPGHATLQTGPGSNQMLINIANLQNGQMNQTEQTIPKVVTIPQVVVARQPKTNKRAMDSQQTNINRRSPAKSPKVNFIHVKQENVHATNTDVLGKQMLYKNQLIVKQFDNTASSSVTIKREPASLPVPAIVKQEPVMSTAIPSCIVKQEPYTTTVKSQGETVFSLPASGQCNKAHIENAFVSPNYMTTSSGFTTAQTTTTTTTVSQSSTSMSHFNMPNSLPNVVSLVELDQNIASSSVCGSMTPASSAVNSFTTTSTVQGGAPISSAKPTGGMATLQTIHLPPDIQQKFQSVRLEIDRVNKQTNLSPQERQKRLQQLNIFQRQILLKGRVLATTKAEPHHIQQGLQSLSKSGLNSPPAGSASAAGSTAASMSAAGQHDNKPIVLQTVPSFNQTVLHNTNNTTPNSQGQISHQVQGHLHGDGILTQSAQRRPVENSQHPSQNLQGQHQAMQEQFQNIQSSAVKVEPIENPMPSCAGFGVSSPMTLAASQSYSTSRSEATFDTSLYQRQPDSTTSIGQAASSTRLIDSPRGAPADNMLSALLTSTKKSTPDILPSYISNIPHSAGEDHPSQPRYIPSHPSTVVTTTTDTVPGLGQGPTSITTGATPMSASGETTVPSSPQVAVPTQIKIAHKVLTLSLTPAQKEKVQSYLDRMTPEQQQQYLQTQQGVLQRIQKQQMLNAQIRAQVEAQKQQAASRENPQPNLASLITQKLQLQKLSGLDGQQSGTDGRMAGQKDDHVRDGGQKPHPSAGTGLLLQPKIEASSPPSTHQQVPDMRAAPVVQIKPEVVTIKSELKTVPVPTIQIHPSAHTESPQRGTKRNFKDIPKGTLISQQIKQDQHHATNPDTKRPFRSRGDACRRLLRYHVFQGHGPSQQEFDKFDSVMEDAAQALLTKRDRMIERFRYLLMQESMRPCSSSELVMLQRIQNQELRKLHEDEKKLANADPDAFMQQTVKPEKDEAVSPACDIDVDDSMDDPDTSANTDSTDNIKNDFDQDMDKKVKKLVIKSDGMNFSSSFKRQSLDSNRCGSSCSGESEGDSGTPVNVSDDGAACNSAACRGACSGACNRDTIRELVEVVEEELVTDFNIDGDQGSPLQVVSGNCDLTNDDDSDTNEYNGDIPMQEEADTAALTISSADDSQDDTLVSDGTDQSSHSISFDQNNHSDKLSTNTVTTIQNSIFPRPVCSSDASQSNYFEQTSEHMEFFSMSHISGNKTSHTYIPDHSPVSNDSIENDNANNSASLFDDAAFSSLHMYQPITESLTDSEENSYYSTDNSAEQNSTTGKNAETGRQRGKRVKWDESTAVQIDSDSDAVEDSDPEVKAQMESAINSILSLSQGAPLSESLNFNQSNHLYTSNIGRTNSSSQSNHSILFTDDQELTSVYSDSPSPSNKTSDSEVTVVSPPVSGGNESDNVIVIDEDLDAAVQSILM